MSEHKDYRTREEYENNAVCDECGKGIYVEPSRQEKHNNCFCSQDCYFEHKKSGEKPKNTQCSNCGINLRRNNYELENRDNHFCDHSCFGEWLSDNKTGENSPRWKPGTENVYCGGWKRQREVARERDDNECIICGSENNLEVHHVVPARKFAEPEDAHKMINIVTLCKQHHSEIEGSRNNPRLERKLSKEEVINA